jgi:hypothetical protein
MSELFRPDPFLTAFGRYDNARLAIPGGLNVPGGAPPLANGGPALPVNGGVELVVWNKNQPARGRGLRLWANPEANYNLQTAAEVPGLNANSLSIELLATLTGFGGAFTTRRFVVNGGQEAILSLGDYESGKVEIVAASSALNVVAPLTAEQNQGWANFAWLTGDSALTSAVETKLMTRVFQAVVLAAPAANVRVVVPPGATGFKPFGQVHVGPVNFAWPTTANPTTLSRAGAVALVPMNTFPLILPSQIVPVRGAKSLDLEAPLGWPFNTLQFQFELASF